MEDFKKPEYDTKNAEKIIKLLKSHPRGLTIAEISNYLNLNRHTVAKILERLLIEKRVDYEEKGPAKIFYLVGNGKFVGKINQVSDIIWIDVFRPEFGEPFVRLNQTKRDNLIRSSSKYRSIGSVAIKKSSIKRIISILKKVAKEEFGINV